MSLEPCSFVAALREPCSFVFRRGAERAVLFCRGAESAAFETLRRQLPGQRSPTIIFAQAPRDLDIAGRRPLERCGGYQPRITPRRSNHRIRGPRSPHWPLGARRCVCRRLPARGLLARLVRQRRHLLHGVVHLQHGTPALARTAHACCAPPRVEGWRLEGFGGGHLSGGVRDRDGSRVRDVASGRCAPTATSSFASVPRSPSTAG